MNPNKRCLRTRTNNKVYKTAMLTNLRLHTICVYIVILINPHITDPVEGKTEAALKSMRL